jgi:hypothetical protein
MVYIYVYIYNIYIYYIDDYTLRILYSRFTISSGVTNGKTVITDAANPGDVLEIDEVLVVLVLLELEVEELVLDEPQVQGCAG